MNKDLKYLTAYLIPLSAFVAILLQGWYSYLTFVIIFVLIPIVEPFLPSDSTNLDASTKELKLKDSLFDLLLLFNVPIVFGLLFYFLHVISVESLQPYELIGLVLSVGISMGSNGINVAHELGHKPEVYKKRMAQLLLLPSQYMHFFIEHNFGHHKYIATKEDPATARKNEAVYFFWIRSVVMSYISAWKIEKAQLAKRNLSFLSLQNAMIHFAILQICFIAFVFYVFGSFPTKIYLCCALVSILLLETINYIEHYGLLRKKLSNGRYERVLPEHSWNSNHELGRILLYELTRHSDHHFLASKKYQILDHHDTARQLPFGYPTSMIISLFPPIWFKLMNSKLI